MDHKYAAAWWGLVVPWGFFFAWMMMLIVGLAHRHWWAGMPPAGYVFCLSVTGLLMVLGGLGQAVKTTITEMLK